MIENIQFRFENLTLPTLYGYLIILPSLEETFYEYLKFAKFSLLKYLIINIFS